MSQKIPHSIFEMRINSILQGGQLGPSSNRLEGEQLAPENCGTLKIPEMDKSGISEPVVFDYGHTHKSLKSPYSRQAVQDRLTSDIDIQSTNSEYRSESSISLSGQFSDQSNQSSSFYESQKKGTSIANMPKSILKKRIPTISSDTGSAMFDVLSPMSQDLVVAKRPVSGCSRKNIVPVDLDGHFGSTSVNKSLPVASTSTKVTHAPSKPTIAYPMHLYTNQADNIQQIEPIASKMISPTTKMKRKRGSYYSSLTVPVTSSEETPYAGMGQNKQQLQTKRSDSLSLIGLAYDELPSTESAVPSASKYRLVEENQSTYSKLPFYQTSNSSAITIAPVQPASVCRSIEQDPTLSPSSQIYGVPVIDENSQMSTFVASTYGTPAQMPSQMPVYTQPQVTSPPLVQMPVYSTSRVSPITPSVTNEHIYGSVPPPYEYAKMVATAPKYQTLKASGKDIYSQSAYSSNYESAVQKELSSLNSDAISYFVRAIRSRERRNYFGSRQAIRCTRAGSIDRSRNRSSRSNSRERRRSRSRKRNVRSHSRGQRSESRDRISESKSRHSDNKSQSQTGRISRTHLSRSNAKKKVTDSKSKNSKSSDSAGQTDKSKVASKDSDSKTDKSKAASKEGGSKIDDKSKAASKDSGSKTDKSEAASKDGGVINDKGQISSKDSDSKVDKKKVPSKEDIKKAFPGRVAHIVPEEKETDVRIQINLLNKGKTPEEASKTKENKDASEVIKSRPELSEMAKQLIAKVEAKKQKEIVAKKVSHNETKKTEQIVDRCVQISKMESSPTPIKKTAEKNIQTDSELSSVCPMEPGLKKETEDELINSCTWISELKSKMHRIPENFFIKVYEDCLQDVADTMARDIPLGWVLVQHVTGTPVYMHTETKVCCVTKPYFIGSNVPEIHNIPVSAVPCLQYRENLDKHLFDKYQSLRITTPTPPPPPPPPKVEIKENKVETKSKILCPSSSHQPQSKDRNRGKSTGSKTRTRSRSAHQDGRGHTAKSSSRTDNAGHCGNHSLGQNKDSGTSVRSQSSDLGKDSSRKCGHSCDKDEQESSSSRGQKQKRDQNSSKRESSFRGGNLQDRSRYRHNSTDRKSDNSSMHVQDQNLSTSSSHRPVCVGSRDGNRRSEAGDQWKPRGRQTSMLSNTSSSEKKKCEKEKSKKSENITSVVAKYIADMEDVSSDEIADVSDGYDVEDISSDELEEDFESEMLAAFGAYQDELGEGYCFISDEDMEVNATEKSDSKVDGKADEIEREVKQKEGTDNTKNTEKDKNVDTTKKILGEKHFPATDDKDSLASNRKLSVSSRAKVPCKQSVVEVSSVVSKDCPAEKDVKTESKVITANSETKDSKQVIESSKIKSSLIETETFSFAKPLDLKQTTESSEAKSTSIETKPNYLIENEHKVDKSTEDEAVSVKKPVTRMATRATKLSMGPAKTIVVTRARKTQKALTTPGDISNSTSVPSADQEITETPELKTTAKVTMISVEHSTEPTESLSIEGTHKITQSTPTKKSLTLVVKSTQPADKATAVVQHDDNTTIDESQISSDTSSKSVEENGVKRKPKQCDGQTVEATEQVSAAPKPSATPRKTTTAQAVTTLNPTVGTTAAAETNQGDIQTKTTHKEAPTTPKPAVDNVAAIKTNQSDIDTNTTPKPEVSTAAVVAKTNQVDIQTKTTHKEAPTTPKPAVDNVAAIKTNQSDIDTNTTLKPEVSTAAVVAKTNQGDIQTKTTNKEAPTTPKPAVDNVAAIKTNQSDIDTNTTPKPEVSTAAVVAKTNQVDIQTKTTHKEAPTTPKPAVDNVAAIKTNQSDIDTNTTLKPEVSTAAVVAKTNQGDIQTKTTNKEAPTTPKPAVDNVAAIKTNQSDIDTNTTLKPEVSTAAVVAKTNQGDIQTKTTHKEAPTTPKPAVDNVAAIKTNQSDIGTNTTPKPEVSTAAVVAKTHQGDIQTKTTPKQAPTTPKPVVGTSTVAAEMSQGDIQTQRTLKQAPTTPKLVVGTTAAKTNQGDVPTKTTPKPVVITTAACDTNQVDVQRKRPAKQASNTSKPAVGTTEMFKTNKSEAQGLKTCKEVPTIPTTAEATGTNSEAQTGKKHSSDLIKTAKPEDVQATRTTPTKTVLAAVGNKLAQMLTQSVKTSNLKSDPGDSKPKQIESSQNYGAATNVISHGDESTTNSDPAQPAQGVTCTESVKEEQCIKGESIVEDKVLDLPVFDHEFLKRYNARLFLFHDEVLPQRLFWNNRQLLLQLRKKLEEKKKPEEVKEDPKPEVKPESGIVIEPMEGIETQSVLQSKVEVKKEIKVEPNTEAKEETKTELEHKEEKKQKDPLSDVLKKYVKENMSGVAVHFLIQNKNNEVSCSTIFGSQVQATETASTGEKAKERAAYATLCQVLPEEYKKEEMERFFNPAPTEPPESPSDAGKAVVLKSQLTRSETASSDIKAQKRVGSPLAVPPAKVIKSDETEQEKLGIQKKRGTVLMDPVLKNRLSDPNVKIEKLDIEDPLVFPLCLKQNYMTPLQILTAYFEKNSISDDKVEWEFSQFDKERLPEHTLLLTVGKPVPQWSVKVSCRSKIQGKMKASTSLLKKLQEQKIYNPTHFQSYSFRSKLSPYEHFMKFIRSQNIDEDKVEWHFDMNDGKQESSMTVTVGKPIPRMHVKVSCKNKVEGKQKAAQSLLKKLHPPGLKYGFLLHMYEGTQNVKKILDLKKTGLKNLQQLILDHIFHNNIKELREKEFRNLASVPTLRDTLNKLTKLDNKICLEKSELPKLPVEVDVDSISSAMKLLEENGNVCTKFNQESGETLFENLKLQKDAQSNLERTVLAVLTRVVSLPAYNDEGYNIFELLFEARKYPGYSMVRNSAIRFCLDRLKLKNLVREDANEHFHPVPPS